ncbi:hypothetical protein E2C01_044341 [Portunus trituberculatus]|uniref:Uncharacterized protein n=1 Tax=Portunus trituberculatus TaxID=210409 RepID=A0A5B7FVD3_PORTR|nr:hypothetical protein [Portunus trituberculatus]
MEEQRQRESFNGIMLCFAGVMVLLPPLCAVLNECCTQEGCLCYLACIPEMIFFTKTTEATCFSQLHKPLAFLTLASLFIHPKFQTVYAGPVLS